MLLSNVSAIFKIALVCLLLGFVAGLCTAGELLDRQPHEPTPSVSPEQNTALALARWL